MAIRRPHLRQVQVTGIDDDPFVRAPRTQRMSPSDFRRVDGQPVGLEGPRVKIVESERLDGRYWKNERGGLDGFYATNPYALPGPTSIGQFLFPAEPRLPALIVARQPDGTPELDRDGMQQWRTSQPAHLGQTVAFKAANDVSRAFESWEGRRVPWGTHGQLIINVHETLETNAYYSRDDRQLHLSVVPYEDEATGERLLFDMASSYDVVAHEAGHAIHDALKPYRSPPGGAGSTELGESMGDQTAMWVSLRDPIRVTQILAETGGDLSKLSSLTRSGEFAQHLEAGALGPGRELLSLAKVSTTQHEPHDRSRVLTGVAYRTFVSIYDELRSNPRNMQPADAMRHAADIMGRFLARIHDYMPDMFLSAEAVGRAYLSVDQEFFGGKYHKLLTQALKQSEIFDDNSEAKWRAARETLPKLTLKPLTCAAVPKLIQANRSKLGIADGLELKILEVSVDGAGQHVARLQLIGAPLDRYVDYPNYGHLVFRRDGTVAEYQSPALGLGGEG